MVNTHRIDIRLGARLIQTRVIPALLLAAAAASQAQTPARAATAPLAPGVSRAVEHPDTSLPDPTVDQTLPDEHQPETAVDHEPGEPETAIGHERGDPETAREDQKLTPETARNAQKLTPETARDDQKLTPETARDDQKLTPETARDDQKLTPETASDAPKPSKSRQAAELAKQGVRSNTPPPPAKPQS